MGLASLFHLSHSKNISSFGCHPSSDVLLGPFSLQSPFALFIQTVQILEIIIIITLDSSHRNKFNYENVSVYTFVVIIVNAIGLVIQNIVQSQVSVIYDFEASKIHRFLLDTKQYANNID